MTLTKCRAPVSVVSDIVMEERSWGTFLSSYLEIISSPPPHSPLAHAVIRLPSKTPLRACFLGSDQIPQLFSFPLMSSLKGASYCLPPSSHCVYSSQTRKNWLCASPLFVLPMVFTVPPPPPPGWIIAEAGDKQNLFGSNMGRSKHICTLWDPVVTLMR